MIDDDYLQLNRLLNPRTSIGLNKRLIKKDDVIRSLLRPLTMTIIIGPKFVHIPYLLLITLFAYYYIAIT